VSRLGLDRGGVSRAIIAPYRELRRGSKLVMDYRLHELIKKLYLLGILLDGSLGWAVGSPASGVGVLVSLDLQEVESMARVGHRG